jgi:hypothetical protein
MKKKTFSVDEALKHPDHSRPKTRREFISQGFMTGSATVAGANLLNIFSHSSSAFADLAGDIDVLRAPGICDLKNAGAGKIPFICFDLAGGANLAGSNVLVGQGGGQMDLLSTAGYSKLGLPGDMIPGLSEAGSGITTLNATTSNGDFTDSFLNLMFHADSPMLFGILEKASAAIGNVDGCVIPARSGNDTSNNPHNPLYALAKTGARGSVVDLIGSRSSDSGGNSMSPAMYIDPEFRPTKVDRASDVTGLVDVGDLTQILEPSDVTAVMESIARVTHKKLQLSDIQTGLSNDLVIKDLVRCGYLKASDIAERFAGREIDPTLDDQIAGPIFSATEFGDREFIKTASVMKMVMNGYAAGGCITMGGYDYHTGDRRVGENRDLRAGRCIGACLEYARLLGSPLMIYVYSDGSVFSNGNSDDSDSTGTGENLVIGGRGKGQWTGDNSSTACSFFLMHKPGGPQLVGSRQIGRMSADASVVTTATPAANNVNLLVNMVMLNYMAASGQVSPGNTGAFTSIFPNHGLGSQSNLDSFISFGSLL